MYYILTWFVADRNNLGEAWYSKGEYDKAIEYFELALEIFEKKLGSNHPYTKDGFNKLARAKRKSKVR